MASSSFWAYGSKFQIGNGGSPETFADVAEIIDITPPNMERDDIDVTNQQSTDGWKEFLPGWRDGGEVSFDCNWLPNDSTQDEISGLVKSFNTDTRQNFRVVLPGSVATLAFSGFVKGVEPDLPLEEQGQISFTVKVSGKVTFS